MSLLTNEQLTLNAINLDSLNDLLNETHSKLGKPKYYYYVFDEFDQLFSYI